MKKAFLLIALCALLAGLGAASAAADNGQTACTSTVIGSSCAAVIIPAPSPQGSNGGSSGQGSTSTADACSNLDGDQASVPAGYLPAGDGTCFEPDWVLVCLTSPHVRAGDGSTGLFFQILDSEWKAGVNDPSSIYYQASPAIYVQGYGTVCSISDVFTYGGDPAAFRDAGYRVNESGQPTPQGVSPADWGAIYEEWIPALRL